jgi:hypothetical protein
MQVNTTAPSETMRLVTKRSIREFYNACLRVFGTPYEPTTVKFNLSAAISDCLSSMFSIVLLNKIRLIPGMAQRLQNGCSYGHPPLSRGSVSVLQYPVANHCLNSIERGL